MWSKLLESSKCVGERCSKFVAWWRHQMETFSALLALCAGPTGEFPSQRPVTRSFDVRLSKQWWGWWFEMPSRPLWRHSNVDCAIVWLPQCQWSHAENMGNSPPPQQTPNRAYISWGVLSKTISICTLTKRKLGQRCAKALLKENDGLW